MLGRLRVESWDEADEDERQDALMMATQRLDVEPYMGTTASSTQRLQWPRYGVSDRNGYTIASTVIPREIQDATYELALAVLDDPDAFGSASGLSEFQNLRLGSFDATPRQGQQSTLPPGVLRLLQHYRLGGMQNRVVRA